MAGTVLRLLPRTDFNLSPAWAASHSFTIPLVQNIDVSAWTEGTLILRVHSATAVLPAAGAMKFVLKAVAPSEDDPAVFFRGTTVASCDVSNGMAVGTLLQSSVSANAGGMVSLFLFFSLAGTGGAASCTVSIDLSLKN